MSMWRCPHCGTPQTEAARCWVCRRSSTVCGTCRNFRRAVAGGLAYCALDPGRGPLVGDELRACWEGRATSPEPGLAGTARHAGSGPTSRRTDFVPVDAVAAPAEPATGPAIPAGRRVATLWGDPEP